MSETEREQRFKRVASARIEKILYNLRSLAKCSNTGNYFYSQREVSKMFRAIDEELRTCKAAYRKKTNNQKFSF